MSILTVAQRYVGLHEGTAAHTGIIDAYNSIKPLPRGYRVTYQDSWCAVFVTFCADQAGLQNFPRECGVFEMRKKFNNDYYYLVKKPAREDIIFYSYSHVGIVENVEGDLVYTIEGNANDMVMRQVHNLNASYIAGFGRINTKPEVIARTPELTLVARKVIAGRYGNQPERQKNLEAEGWNYAEVQAVVNAMLNV